MNIAKFLRIAILKNMCEWLFLEADTLSKQIYRNTPLENLILVKFERVD